MLRLEDDLAEELLDALLPEELRDDALPVLLLLCADVLPSLSAIPLLPVNKNHEARERGAFRTPLQTPCLFLFYVLYNLALHPELLQKAPQFFARDAKHSSRCRNHRRQRP